MQGDMPQVPWAKKMPGPRSPSSFALVSAAPELPGRQKLLPDGDRAVLQEREVPLSGRYDPHRVLAQEHYDFSDVAP